MEIKGCWNLKESLDTQRWDETSRPCRGTPVTRYETFHYEVRCTEPRDFGSALPWTRRQGCSDNVLSTQLRQLYHREVCYRFKEQRLTAVTGDVDNNRSAGGRWSVKKKICLQQTKPNGADEGLLFVTILNKYGGSWA